MELEGDRETVRRMGICFAHLVYPCILFVSRFSKSEAQASDTCQLGFSSELFRFLAWRLWQAEANAEDGYLQSWRDHQEDCFGQSLCLSFESATCTLKGSVPEELAMTMENACTIACTVNFDYPPRRTGVRGTVERGCPHSSR
eukprot:TRINITY_DN829_c0_g1_i2.p3 TRINITY_DN829_c0_g1~~TRINITY_DN829_c0_g1_i2.p3  ORF type:complete len:143 (+),score=1.90 TRINITY_DN829_c0_g1_i2:628-1056(+)